MEFWKVIPNYSKYEISKTGKLRNKETKFELSLKPNKGHGYVVVFVKNDNDERKGLLIHRAVMLTFVGESENPSDTVDHINRIKHDNSLENLRWVNKSIQSTNVNRSYKNSFVILKFDQDNNLLEQFGNLKLAAETVNGRKSDLGKAIKNKKLYKEFNWQYEQVVNLDNEIWKPITKNDKTNYISNMGRVKDLKNRLKIQSTSNAYKRISFNKKLHCVHKLVAELFIPNPNNYSIANHKDGDSKNNRASNLEWVTQSMNVQHAYDNGRDK